MKRRTVRLVDDDDLISQINSQSLPGSLLEEEIIWERYELQGTLSRRGLVSLD